MPSFCFIWWSVGDSEPKRARLTQCFETFFYARSAKYFAFCRVQMIDCSKETTIGCAYAHPIVVFLCVNTYFDTICVHPLKSAYSLPQMRTIKLTDKLEFADYSTNRYRSRLSDLSSYANPFLIAIFLLAICLSSHSMTQLSIPKYLAHFISSLVTSSAIPIPQ